MRDCCPILVIPDISWDSVKEGHMGPAVIQLCIHVTADELRFDVFSAHTGRLSVNIRCKKCGIGELLTQRGVRRRRRRSQSTSHLPAMHRAKTITCRHQKLFIFQYFSQLRMFSARRLLLTVASKTLKDTPVNRLSGTLSRIKCRR